MKRKDRTLYRMLTYLLREGRMLGILGLLGLLLVAAAQAEAPATSGGSSAPRSSLSGIDVTFVVVGDPQIYPGDVGLPESEQVVRTINSLTGQTWPDQCGEEPCGGAGQPIDPPRGVIIVGDLTYERTYTGHSYPGDQYCCTTYPSSQCGGATGEPCVFTQFRRTYENLLAYPLYVGLGNHDIAETYWDVMVLCAGTENEACRKDAWNYVRQRHDPATGNDNYDWFVPVDRFDPDSHAYSWDWDDLHLVQLHKFGGDTDFGHPSSLDWLRDDLGSTDQRPVILFQHYGWLYEDGDMWNDFQRRELNRVVAGSNIVGAFNGHLHAWSHHTDPDLGNGEVDIFRPGEPPEFATVHVTDRYMDVVWYTSTVTPTEPIMVHAFTKRLDNAPSISDVDKSVPLDNDILFTAADFSSQFSDLDGDAMMGVEIQSLPEHGTLKLAGNPAKVGQGIWSSELDSLVFTPDSNWIGLTRFGWRAIDGYDRWSSTADVNITVLDTIPPTCSISIDSGASTAYSALVRVNHNATDAGSGISHMRLRGVGGSWDGWQSCLACSPYWQLPPVTGQPYTVEAQFMDRAGNVSAICSDSIALDIYPARPASAHYRVSSSTWGASGASGSSSNYVRHSTLGQPSPIGRLASTSFALASGYWGDESRDQPRPAIAVIYLPIVIRR